MWWLQLLFSIGDAGLECLTADFGISAILTTIGLAITAASAATSAGMAAKSAADARRQEDKNRAQIEKERQEHERIFNLRYHQNMTDRTEVQGALRELREQQDAQRSQNEARAAVNGDTKEQQIAEQQGLNKAYADSVAEIASNSSMLKDGYLDNYENNLGKYYDSMRQHNTTMSQIEMNRSNQWAQAANNAVQAMAGSAQSLAGMVGGGPAKAPAAPAAEGPAKVQAAGPTQIGNNGMQMNPDGSFSNPKLNPYDRMSQQMSQQYQIGKPSGVTYQPWGKVYTTPTTFKTRY